MRSSLSSSAGRGGLAGPGLVEHVLVLRVAENEAALAPFLRNEEVEPAHARVDRHDSAAALANASPRFRSVRVEMLKPTFFLAPVYPNLGVACSTSPQP